MAGTLYLVATPIGNLEDLTFRAVRVLREVDLVVFEERREGLRLLRHLGIEKPVESLNEHNELAATEVVVAALGDGKNVAVVSDAGTPVFNDPGRLLVRRAIKQRIRIVPVPGASSLMPALIVSGFPIGQFFFCGFLSPKRERRLTELQQLKRDPRTIVLMETPYRLIQLVRDIAAVMGERPASIAFDITLPTEEFLHGTAAELHQLLLKEPRKGEFVILLEGKG